MLPKVYDTKTPLKNDVVATSPVFINDETALLSVLAYKVQSLVYVSDLLDATALMP